MRREQPAVGRLWLTVLTALVLLSACRFPGTVRPTIKIGLAGPFEGRYRAIGYDVIYAVRLALQEVNSAGGVAGYGVELVAYDDGADPQQAAIQARKLVSDSDLVAVIGHFREASTAGALETYANAGLPLIAPGVLCDELTAGDAPAYRLGPPAETLAAEMLGVLAQAGITRTVVVDLGDPLAESLQRLASQTDGIQLEKAAPASDDGWAEQALAHGAQAVACTADAVACAEILTTLYEAGWSGLFLGGPDLSNGDFAAIAGEAIRGCRTITPWPDPTRWAGDDDFVAAYRTISGGLTPGPIALAAYEATWILLEALERDIATHQRPTRQGMAQALLATDRKGLLGSITFDEARSWSSAPLYDVQCTN